MDVNGAANFQNDLEETEWITRQGTSILPCESEVRWNNSDVERKHESMISWCRSYRSYRAYRSYRS